MSLSKQKIFLIYNMLVCDITIKLYQHVHPAFEKNIIEKENNAMSGR